jgi:hypothetical protein
MSTTVIEQTNPASSSSIVNGIDTDAVHALIDDVDTDAAKGMTHWRVASVWQGGTHSRARVEGFAIGGVEVSRCFSSTSTSLSSWVEAMPLPTPRSTCSRPSTPA